jgi:hypothetical protein
MINSFCVETIHIASICKRLSLIEMFFVLCSRVARWFILKTKFPLWVNFGRSCNRRCCYVLWPFGIFYGQLVNSMAIWYILWSFGKFFLVLVFCTKKNLATLLCSRIRLSIPFSLARWRHLDSHVLLKNNKAECLNPVFLVVSLAPNYYRLFFPNTLIKAINYSVLESANRKRSS